MARAAIEDPIKNFRFRLIVNGFVRAGFSEVSGLERDTDVAEYREGGFNETPQKSAGLTKYADITMKRGLIIGSSRGGEDDFIEWASQVHQLSTNGNATNYRKDLSIVQYDATNQPVRKWAVRNAFPKRFKAMSDMNATNNDNSIEELTLVHEGFEKTY